MGLRSRISKNINTTQIKALLRKDLLVRLRQPWLTAVQFVWPLLIFSAVYLLRFRFNAYYVDDCQFPTRELPSPTTILPFFQSYICTIENECSSITNYTEISDFPNAPVSPVLTIIQTFLNEDKLYHAVVDLPESADFLGTITAIASHPKFKVLEENVGKLTSMLAANGLPIGADFDINNLFADDRTFSKSGNILCGKPFPRSHQIRLIERVFYSEDFKGANDEELNVMPTPYCKQLYIDVTNTNNGKITWSFIKPIIAGKILYGPVNEQTNKIMINANQTLDSMNRLKTLLKGVDTVIKKLRVEGDFREKFMKIVQLADTPLVKMLLTNFGIDKKVLDSLFDGLLYDKQVAEITETIANILECFSVDRFIGVDSKQEMEDLAIELNDKKLFYAGVYFDADGLDDHKYSYTIRMDADNTPGTVDNRDRFWFPGPKAHFELQHRYHRGFIQIQHIIDQAIIKLNVDEKNAALEEEWKQRKANETATAADNETTESAEKNDNDDNDNFASNVNEPSDTDEVLEYSSSTDNAASLAVLNSFDSIRLNAFNDTDNVNEENDDDLSSIGFDEPTDEGAKPKIRRKRQFDFFGDLLGGGGSADEKSEYNAIEFGNIQTFTKQFPYPRYFSDDYQIGVYLAQIIQLLYFFALIGQVANAVRYRVWMKESGNSRLMTIMGLQPASENVAWIISTFIDLGITFFITEFILYMGGTLHTTNRLLLFLFLLQFSACIISFCYMMSNFFESASIGSVSTVIIFLMTYMPYIIIVALGSMVSSESKIFASLSFATSFCYAWRYIMRLEIQRRPLSFSTAFDGTLHTNDFKLAIVMITVDIVLYAVIGYYVEQWRKNDAKCHEIEKKDMDISVGGALQNCTKNYEGSETAAIDSVSIVFRRDVVTCLLGRNGAGKSTIIKLLTGQIEPTSGKVYWPQNWDRITGNEFDERVGVCPQNNILIPNLTAREHLEMYVRIKTKQIGGDKEVERVMSLLHFGKYENYYSQHLSGGFKRRLNVAIAFISSPNLVILDEPCSGVDVKARKNIWDLVSSLRQGRAVVLATHHLDEAEHLSDNILILKEGKVIAEYNAETLKNQFTQSFELHVNFETMNNSSAIEAIEKSLKEHAPPHYSIKNTPSGSFVAIIPYKSNENDDLWNHTALIRSLEQLIRSKAIQSFRIVNSNLDRVFNDLASPAIEPSPILNGNSFSAYDAEKKNTENGTLSIMQREPLSEWEIMKNLFSKRFLHFKRNYRLIVCVLVLPVLFEMLAMGLMIQRPPGEHGVNLPFSSALYPDSEEVYSHENDDDVLRDIFYEFTTHYKDGESDELGNTCKMFNSSERLFRWVVNTTNDYPESRYGGFSSNATRSMIWYNNAGYHAMPVFLNKFSTSYLRTLMNSSNFDIKTRNHPLIMAHQQISTTSILQQLGDAAVSLIILIAFSLVSAGASNYIVNERVSGEKLQQKLSDVTFRTYWGVSFIWDFSVYIIALLLAAIVFRIFNLPVFVDHDNLYGVCLLLLCFGFSTTNMVHLCEKLFNEASIANMYILCMNIMFGLCTAMTIILFDVLGESELSDQIRHILNRIFLILPQHALADGLIEICKNDIVAKLFERFYIDTYKSPIKTNLVVPHCISLICTGIIFWFINYVIESGVWRLYLKKTRNMASENIDLEAISTVHQNGTILADDLKKRDTTDYAMTVDKLSKRYGYHEAVKDVSFNVKLGECFGLLGANGAGKSTIFAMLSGELAPTSGTINILNRDNGIAYCPQTNPLDNLLTVQEIMYFYGQLRRIKNVHEVSERSLHRFHLLPYRHVLVKNLSGGNRRKLSVAVTCFGSSSTVLMDEPTSDMDPITRSLVYNAINCLLLERRSVVLTSHTITEIDRVCDRIGIMRLGKMIITAPPSQLKSMYGNRYAITVYYDEIEALTIERDIRKAIPCVEDLTVYNHCLQFRIKIQAIQQAHNPNGNAYNSNSNSSNFIKNNNNEQHVSEAVIDDGMIFSELVDKLYMLSVDRGITFTITECLLDQAFERVLDTNRTNHSYHNSAYTSTETPS